MTDQKELPRYQCHKIVRAVKIAAIEQTPADGGTWKIALAEVGYGRITVPRAFIEKHNPHVGGYYVVYDDGYASFSPAKAFEDGYTRI